MPVLTCCETFPGAIVCPALSAFILPIEYGKAMLPLPAKSSTVLPSVFAVGSLVSSTSFTPIVPVNFGPFGMYK